MATEEFQDMDGGDPFIVTDETYVNPILRLGNIFSGCRLH